MTKLYIPGEPTDYYMEASRGNITGQTPVFLIGNNPDVDGPEDIWSAGGTWVAPVAATQHNIVSSDANDTFNGTGVKSITVQGLDADWNRISEVVFMNGTTNVLTSKSYIRLYKLFAYTFGSGETNAGNITATTADAATTVTEYMPAGKGASLSAIYSTPAGKTGYITAFGGTCLKAGASGSAVVEIDLQIRVGADAATSGWITGIEGGLSANGSSSTNFSPNIHPIIPEKSDMKVRVTVASTTNIDVAARLSLLLIDN